MNLISKRWGVRPVLPHHSGSPEMPAGAIIIGGIYSPFRFHIIWSRHWEAGSGRGGKLAGVSSSRGAYSHALLAR